MFNSIRNCQTVFQSVSTSNFTFPPARNEGSSCYTSSSVLCQYFWGKFAHIIWIPTSFFSFFFCLFWAMPAEYGIPTSSLFPWHWGPDKWWLLKVRRWQTADTDQACPLSKPGLPTMLLFCLEPRGFNQHWFPPSFPTKGHGAKFGNILLLLLPQLERVPLASRGVEVRDAPKHPTMRRTGHPPSPQ